jgi:endonuclease G
MTTQQPGPVDPRCDVPYEELLTGLRRLIRAEGRRYLDDPNITSIGLGHRVVGGRETGELVVTVAGVRVPTDVLERRSQPALTRPSTPVPGERPARAAV